MTLPAHALEAQRLAEKLRGQGDQPLPLFEVPPAWPESGRCGACATDRARAWLRYDTDGGGV